MRIALTFSLAALVMPLLLGAGCSAGPVDTSTPTQNVDAVVQPSSDSTQTSNQPMPTFTSQGKLPDSEIQNKQVRITTDAGDIVIALYPDTAPLAVSNFIYLAKNNFYDGVIFHRVISDFMIQGGDPTGTGMGGPGYKFADELEDSNTYSRGTVAMANAGPDTNGSQFFIMHKDYALPHDYTIFGKVISGLEAVDAIAATPTDGNPPIGSNRPLSEQKMTKVVVEDVK